MTIWKFPLPFSQDIALTMPAKARPLCVQLQGDVPTLWAIVDPLSSNQTWQFRIQGTGHPIELQDGEGYIGTWQKDGYVWHLFGPEATL